VRAWGCEARQGSIRVHAAPSAAGPGRVGLATPGLGRAVDRNTLRRRLRAAVRVLAGEGELEELDVIVSAGREALRVPFSQLAAEVRGAADAAAARVRARAAPGSRSGGS
jgi:ribonuclease P protein component